MADIIKMALGPAVTYFVGIVVNWARTKAGISDKVMIGLIVPILAAVVTWGQTALGAASTLPWYAALVLNLVATFADQLVTKLKNG